MQAFRTAEKWKCHIKDCFEIIDKQTINIPKRREYLKFKNFGRKIKLPFMIYADFESIIVPEDNGKHYPNESYTSKYQKYAACSYGCKLAYVDDKINKPYISYLGKDAVHKFISSMIAENKYCSDVMKKCFNKELIMTEEIMRILRIQLNVGPVIMIYWWWC